MDESRDDGGQVETTIEPVLELREIALRIPGPNRMIRTAQRALDYVFCGRQLLVAYLRPSNIDASKHAWSILSLLVKRLRQTWPGVRIVFRGDSGFCRHRMLDWCDRNDVRYIVGLARNAVLEREVQVACEVARDGFEATGAKNRLFHEFQYAAGSWRVIARIEHGPKGRNPRFIVTNLEGEANELYERVYCARGDMENRIKEQQLALFARDVAPHGASRHRACPSAMPHPSPSAAQDRRRDHPKYPHRGGAVVQRLPRPGRVPPPGAPVDRRIAPISSATSPNTTWNPDPDRRVALRITRTAQEAPKYPSAPLPTDPPGI